MRSHEWGRHLTGRTRRVSTASRCSASGASRAALRISRPSYGSSAATARDSAWRPGFIAVLAELGMMDEARRELDRLLDDGIGTLRPSLWLAALVYLTDACAVLRDESLAEALHRELVPHTGSNTMVGHLVACYGATDRYLGMNATVLGEWERAEEHFEAALALNARLGARTRSRTRPTSTRGCCSPRRGRRPTARPHAARARRRAARAIGMPTPSRTDRGASRGWNRPRRSPTGSAAGSSRSCGLARPVEPRDRPRPPHQRAHRREPRALILRKTRSANRTEAAAYAHRRGLVRGLIHPRYHRSAALRNRARVRRAAPAPRRRRPADRGSQRRRGCQLALLVHLGRPPAHVLPLRGASADAIVEAARRANVPADKIVEVSKFWSPPKRSRAEQGPRARRVRKWACPGTS